MRRFALAGVSAVFVVALIAALAVLSGTREPADETFATLAEPTTTLRASSSIGPTAQPAPLPRRTTAPPDTGAFVPATQTTDGTTTMPIVFPDGTRFEITYESSLGVAELGMRAQMFLRVTTGASAGCGSLIDARQDGHPYDPDVPVLLTISRPDGGEALVRESTGPAASLVVMWADNWELAIPFSEGDACPPDQLAPIWAKSLHGVTTPDGFVVVTASPPVEIDGGYVGADGLPVLYFGALRSNSLTLHRSACTQAPVETLDILPPAVSFCAADGVDVFAQGTAEFREGVVASLQIAAVPSG